MIDISINKLFTLAAGLSVATLSMFEMAFLGAHSEAEAESNIKSVIQLFVKGGDERDTTKLEEVLHGNFRVVANQLMGSSTINVITKDQYLALIREGKLGGDNRVLDIQSVEIIGKNASAKVKIIGKALTFESFYHLIQNNEGKWKLVQDLPFATKN